jgi:hypothetical protein
LIIANASLIVPGAILLESTLAFLVSATASRQVGARSSMVRSGWGADVERLVVLPATRLHHRHRVAFTLVGNVERTDPPGRPMSDPFEVDDLYVTYRSTAGRYRQCAAFRCGWIPVRRWVWLASGGGKSTMTMALLRLVPPGTKVTGSVRWRARTCWR